MTSPTDLVYAALAEVIELTGKPIQATSLFSALLTEALLARECELGGVRRLPFELDPEDVRVEVFTPAVPLNRAVPTTWPHVQVVHLPTGVSASGAAVSVLQAKAAALTELSARVRAQSA